VEGCSVVLKKRHRFAMVGSASESFFLFGHFTSQPRFVLVRFSLAIDAVGQTEDSC
jgi:hypothetical protein